MKYLIMIVLLASIGFCGDVWITLSYKGKIEKEEITLKDISKRDAREYFKASKKLNSIVSRHIVPISDMFTENYAYSEYALEFDQVTISEGTRDVWRYKIHYKE